MQHADGEDGLPSAGQGSLLAQALLTVDAEA
ncbi:MAG: hypothetical protein QOJ21_137 [Solirubrobacteraceae bacterium]|jgi:hypothetical protein|nr:hypothetical protein [Solirubrobacteraceae bacterium]